MAEKNIENGRGLFSKSGHYGQVPWAVVGHQIKEDGRLYGVLPQGGQGHLGLQDSWKILTEELH